MKKYCLVFLVLLFVKAVSAQIKGTDYVVNDNKDVIVTRIIEGLPLQKTEIYTVARRYMEEAYKETKYKIVMDSHESGIITGEGTFDNFHEANYFPYSYFLSAEFQHPRRCKGRQGAAVGNLKLLHGQAFKHERDGGYP